MPLPFARTRLRQLATQCRASVAIEFAIIAPLLIFLLIGVVEVSNYIVFTHKASNATFNTLNILNKLDVICARDLHVVEDTIPDLMAGYEMKPGDYGLYVTYLVARDNAGTTEIETMWQYPTFERRSFPLKPSRFAYDVDNPATNISTTDVLNNFNAYAGGFSFQNSDHLTVVETSFKYKMFFDSALSRSLFSFANFDIISNESLSRPRKRNLQGQPWLGKCL